ncbi:MAG: uracil phosphoribosyltransferase [Elusimicrobiales bacterium]
MTTNLFVSKHPLVQDKVARLRDKRTISADFRRIAGEIAVFLTYDALGSAKTCADTVKTPLGDCAAVRLAQELTVVSILRAGLAMSEAIMRVEPNARFAHIGIYRNEDTLEPVRYYARFPKDISNDFVLLCDPMLATGGSAVEALHILKARGAKHIAFACIIAARQGARRVHQFHPEVPIYAAALDEQLNEKGYIIPGLGDAGDRMFGTV